MPLGSIRRGVGQPGLESRSIFIGRRVNIEVFRASLEVEIFEGLNCLGAATLEDSKLVTIMLLDNGHDVFVGGTGGKGGADGKKGVHSLTSLGDLKPCQSLLPLQQQIAINLRNRTDKTWCGTASYG